MLAALKYLSRVTNDLFELQMSRAARRIERAHIFPRQTA